jgi:hypothetical protein
MMTTVGLLDPTPYLHNHHHGHCQNTTSSRVAAPSNFLSGVTLDIISTGGSRPYGPRYSSAKTDLALQAFRNVEPVIVSRKAKRRSPRQVTHRTAVAHIPTRKDVLIEKLDR